MKGYYFTDKEGSFHMDEPEMNTGLYFPLANEKGIMNSITPDLGGDSKRSQNSFLLAPVSVEDLHNQRASRNFWCRINGKKLWSAAGKSAWQLAERFSEEKGDKSWLEAGMLWHKTVRENKELGIRAEILNFVPLEETAEIMEVEIENIGTGPMELELAAAVPVYGRSADNIRDHRHVTSLLHRIKTVESGVVVNPTMTFDERGHKENTVVYGVFGRECGTAPVSFFPTVADFIKEGGSLENPGALWEKELKGCSTGVEKNGCEALGGLVFEKQEVKQGEKRRVTLVIGYGESEKGICEMAERIFAPEYVEKALEACKDFWRKKNNIHIETKEEGFNQWMHWVSLQPVLRRIYGCSFLPHHDYGRGGRGWRDLWQDCLALLLMEPDKVREMLCDNFAGVRLDGTNATIIGNGQGEFIADRNKISRVWMDHGMWPMITVDLYVGLTGDVEILLEEQKYFKDSQIFRGEKMELPADGKNGRVENEKAEILDCWQHTEDGEIYKGTLLEHLLIEQLTAFFDTGLHNEMRLRGADWNDALDMAAEKGESVAFTAAYAGTMDKLAGLLAELKKKGQTEVLVLEELTQLLGQEDKFASSEEKNKIWRAYCEAFGSRNSGKKSKGKP